MDRSQQVLLNQVDKWLHENNILLNVSCLEEANELYRFSKINHFAEEKSKMAIEFYDILSRSLEHQKHLDSQILDSLPLERFLTAKADKILHILIDISVSLQLEELELNDMIIGITKLINEESRLRKICDEQKIMRMDVKEIAEKRMQSSKNKQYKWTHWNSIMNAKREEYKNRLQELSTIYNGSDVEEQELRYPLMQRLVHNFENFEKMHREKQSELMAVKDLPPV
ncbi:hypothetical protein ROZALSC1DRAFT_26847, partial [Rozella allomycis CSF55]